MSYMHTNNIRLAIREMEECIRIHPSHAVARANLGSLYNYVNQPERALEYGLTAIRLSPNDPRQFIWLPALAGSYYLSGRHEEAMGRRRFREREHLANRRVQLLLVEPAVDVVSADTLLVGSGVEYGEAE